MNRLVALIPLRCEVQKILKSLTERRMGILITDHNVRETLKLVDRAYIIHKGDVRCEEGENSSTIPPRGTFILARNLTCNHAGKKKTKREKVSTQHFLKRKPPRFK